MRKCVGTVVFWTAIFLIGMAYVARGQGQHEPKLYWGDRHVRMDCAQVTHAQTYLLGVIARAQMSTDACGWAKSCSFAESVLIDEARMMLRTLNRLEAFQCKEATVAPSTTPRSEPQG